MKRAATLGIAALLACNVELIEPESVAGDPPRHYLDPTPQIPSRTDETDPTTVWAAAVRRNLAFLTDDALGGRHPGTEGAALTTSAIVSLFSDAGLIPSAPTLGWTTPIGIRAVQVVDPRLAVSIPAAPAELPTGEAPPPQPAGDAERIEISDGLWLHHRGAAGTFHLPMEVVELAPQADLTDRLALGVVPVLEGELIEPEVRIRGIFDAVSHRRPAGCVLELPGVEATELRAAALAWSEPEIQARSLDAEPPPGLAVEGFVSGEAYAALQRASRVTGSTADISFKVEERWFEDSNVVGRIPGRSNPEQVVIVTANWDAGGLERAEGEQGNAQAASGLAVLLAVVERMSRLRNSGRVPARSIVFIAAAGGSLGNLGLEQLAREGLALSENIVAVVHLSDLDWTAPNLTVIGGNRSTVGSRVQALMPLAELTDHEPGFGHLAFDLPRVPRVSLTRRNGSAPEVIDPSIPLTALANTARITFDLVWDLSDAPDVPEVIIPRVDPPPEAQPDPTPPEDDAAL
ncbi:MAG: M28 family peptidase [Nannocystaceae bacterium]|nr:M28 family peptidase [bacterium]